MAMTRFPNLHLWWPLLAVPAFYLACRQILGHLNYNEHMYVMAGYYVSQGLIPYADFAYLQAPLLPYVLGVVYLGWGQPGTYLLLAKGLSAAALAGCMTLLIVWGYTLKLPGYLPVLLAIAFALGWTQLCGFSEASNYALPVFLFMASGYSLWRSRTGHGADALNNTFWSGVWLALAVSTKSYYAVFLPLWAVAVGVRRGWRPLGALVGGGLLGGLPILLHGALTPEAFWFGNVEFHQITTAWKSEIGTPDALRLGARLTYFARQCVRLDLLPVLLATGVALVALFVSHRGRGLFALALILISAAAVLGMTPIYLQYLPLFTATLFGVCLWGLSALSAAHGRRWILPLVALALALTVFQPDAHWRDNRNRIPVHQSIQKSRPDGLKGACVTLSPMLALEWGLEPPLELATGVFTYRIAERLPDAFHKAYCIEGPEDVIRRLDRLPEFGLTGHQVWFDGPIEARLESLGYREEPGPLNTRFWVRPDRAF